MTPIELNRMTPIDGVKYLGSGFSDESGFGNVCLKRGWCISDHIEKDDRTQCLNFFFFFYFFFINTSTICICICLDSRQNTAPGTSLLMLNLTI